MKYNFIKTSDIDTKNKLIEEGFKLVSQDNGMFTFVNNNSITFENTNKKIQYSNILTF
nr:MAG TPA: hypothetical protein [Caudoviricetes sp.]